MNQNPPVSSGIRCMLSRYRRAQATNKKDTTEERLSLGLKGLASSPMLKDGTSLAIRLAYYRIGDSILPSERWHLESVLAEVGPVVEPTSVPQALGRMPDHIAVYKGEARKSSLISSMNLPNS